MGQAQPAAIATGNRRAGRYIDITYPHVDAALQILTDLGFPHQQRNERSALSYWPSLTCVQTDHLSLAETQNPDGRSTADFGWGEYLRVPAEAS
jgi:hypothetical protein